MINIPPLVVNSLFRAENALNRQNMLCILDQTMSYIHGSIMDDMEWVVNSLWDDLRWGIHFWPQIWMEVDSKNQSMH